MRGSDVKEVFLMVVNKVAELVKEDEPKEDLTAEDFKNIGTGRDTPLNSVFRSLTQVCLRCKLFLDLIDPRKKISQ